jgi:hypothetical protein
VLLQRLGRLHRHRAGTVPTAVVLEPGNWDQSVSVDGRPLGGPDHGWAWIYNPLAVRETIEWLRIQGTISVPTNVREIVELATHADHLKNRAEAYGGRWVALWQYVFGNATADAQQALAGLIDRQLSYEQALVNERVPTRLGDGSVDVEVRHAMAAEVHDTSQISISQKLETTMSPEEAMRQYIKMIDAKPL